MTVLDRLLLAGAAACLVLAAVASWLLVASGGSPAVGSEPSVVALAGGSPAAVGPEPAVQIAASPAAETGHIVVDVEGGVASPGVRRLPPGARVADAIAAAGGYGPTADLRAAAHALNLAEPLRDAQQVYVPVAGEADAPTSTTASAGEAAPDDGDGGAVDLNTASPEELDALPGIGPVTVQKIVAAREEAPFTSLEQAVERGVLNRGQLEKIADLATAG
ncbi:MAG TPA: helix-hairpin-helix domain-containing protein [Candidatus Limnocylindria bacterium]|nr:helix-hairpin-helix domain-containing protein [Candidatus Limnocylindria bacterium]